jgi:hypothetical protein
MSENIRIRTTPLGNDNYLKVKLEQDFDFIEILSLKLSQDKAYQNFCSDYGVIVGRVTINNGFGIPNAKVSVFIPIDDVDKEDPHISGLYPYETVSTKNSDGVRYNLLPKESDSQDDCYTVVGTFPAKREVLDNDDMLYVFCKYYKFTTVTNHAGDFMIFGVPLGAHTIHVDADISNIGIASQRPYDLIDQGTPSKSFYSPTKFKDGKNLNTLIQIKTANVGVNVQPFWGNTDSCEIGINRVDIDLNYNIRPAAFFMGSYYGDSRKNSYNKRCRPRKRMGTMCNQVTGEGTIEMLRKDKDGLIEQFDIEGGRLIDGNGTWAYMIPCNLDYVITDEFGRIIPTEDESRGIPTRTRVRFRITMDETGSIGRLRTRGKYLVPHNPSSVNDIDFSFDKSTNDKHFADFYWNKIYTVRNFIARTQKSGASVKTKNYSGVKDVDACVGDKEPMPYNKTYTKSSVIFTILCFIITLITVIVHIINAFLCWLRGVGISTRIISWHPFSGVNPITMKCPSDPEQYFAPGCDGEPDEPYVDCVSAVLAEALDMFTFDFYNDWINGTLYYYLLKYKKRRRNGKEKFCDFYCDDPRGGGSDCYANGICDSTFDGTADVVNHYFSNGTLAKYDDNLYYVPIALDGSNFKLFATDITNLGSIFDCDWQGFPKIIQYLPNSSYKIPPLIMEEDSETGEYVAGMIHLGKSNFVGLYYDINCAGLTTNQTNCANIRRLCELQVDIPDSIGGVPSWAVSIRDIYDISDPVDTITSINRYVRDSFCLLNIGSSSINSFPPPGYSYPAANNTAGGTSFAINGQFNLNDHSNGSLYNTFRGYHQPIQGIGDMAFQAWGNSFFVYFGPIPGASALDKFKSKYLTPCIKFKVDDFIIETSVINCTTNTSADGQIIFNFLGGTAPFVYTITNNSTVNLGPLTATNGGVATNLPQGTYTITATDALGTTSVKEVEVNGPLGLKCTFFITDDVRCINNPDGEASYSIIGGTGPYSGSYVNGTRTGTFTNTSGTITGLDIGSATFTVTDSAGASCTKTLTVGGPPPLTATIKPSPQGFKYVTCTGTNDGFVRPVVSGGTPPYQVRVTRAANMYDANAYDSGWVNYQYANNSNLYPGYYTIQVKDSASCTPPSIITQQFTLYKYIPPTIDLNGTNNKKQCFPSRYDIHFNANQGVPSNPLELPTPPPFNLTCYIDGTPYGYGQLSANGGQYVAISQPISSLLELEIKDTNGCYASVTIPEPAIHRPSILLTLAGTRSLTSGPTGPGPYGVITWVGIGDQYQTFIPFTYQPRDIIPPLMQFNNTYSATSVNPQVGLVTNAVGCQNVNVFAV